MIIDKMYNKKEKHNIANKSIVVYELDGSYYTTAIIHNGLDDRYMLLDMKSLSFWDYKYNTLDDVKNFFKEEGRNVIEVYKHDELEIIPKEIN